MLLYNPIIHKISEKDNQELEQISLEIEEYNCEPIKENKQEEQNIVIIELF